jgi:hypothetical protein
VDADELISRKELEAMLFSISDIREDVREIRALMEVDDGGEEEAP